MRDETKLLGGIGICGRELCCATWLSDFVPVSIKMAKEQNLSLNSAKISGICGRLMCCLKNEEDTYEYLNAQLPSVNSHVRTPDGNTGVVSSVDVLRQKVSVVLSDGTNDEREVREYPVDELKFTPKKRDRKAADGEEQSDSEDSAAEKPAEAAEKSGKNEREKNGRPNRAGDNRDRKNRGPWQDRRSDKKKDRRKDQGNDTP